MLFLDIMKLQSLIPGQEVHLVVLNNEFKLLDEITEELQFKINLIGRPEGSCNPKWIIKYNYILHKIKPDIIHFHNPGTPALTIKTKNSRWIETLHTSGLSLKNRKNIDKIVAISLGVKKDLFHRYGIISETIYNGINFNDIDKNLNLFSPVIYKIVQVGSLNPEIKGQDILLRSISELPGNYQDKVQVEFIGAGEQNRLKQLASELKIDHLVSFKGRLTRKELYRRLKEYHILVQPSRQEGFGLSIVEGLAAGLPVVVSDVEGPMEIIEHGERGLFFPSGNHKTLADKIIELIDNYRYYKERAIVSANKLLNKKYSINRVAENYLQLYEKCLIDG